MGRATRWLRNLLGGKKDPKPASPKPLPSKPRWSFGKTSREHSQTQTQTQPQRSKPWNDRTFYENTEEEQNKHAIAVAAATAAAADAAVAAAQAAVAVVRLTSHGRGSLYHGERFAAVKIQTAFRAYLAKKALRALKALVKLQALVRGFLVRRQAAATLHSMQALIRAQASVRRSRVKDQTRFHPETRARRSLERFEETRSDQTGCYHSRRLSASVDLMSFEESPKIVEIDPGRPRSRQSRRMLHPTASDSTTDNDTLSSPLQPPSRLAIPDSSEWAFTGDECRFSTAQSTPRFLSTAQLASAIPVTPSKSICGGDRRRYDCGSPNYMAKTQSFTAKVRSQSAPKQRPEPRKRMALNEIVESRASLSGIRMQKSCSRAQEAVNFKNAIVGRFDRSSELSSERDYYLQTRW